MTALRDGDHRASPEPQPHTGGPGADTQLCPPPKCLFCGAGGQGGTSRCDTPHPVSPPAPATTAGHQRGVAGTGLCPKPGPMGSSKEHLSRAPCTPPPRGAVRPGASHGRARPAATWVPTMALCPPVGCCISALSSPRPPPAQGSAPFPLQLLAHPTTILPTPVGAPDPCRAGGGSGMGFTHHPSIRKSFRREASCC